MDFRGLQTWRIYSFQSKLRPENGQLKGDPVNRMKASLRVWGKIHSMKEILKETKQVFTEVQESLLTLAEQRELQIIFF